MKVEIKKIFLVFALILISSCSVENNRTVINGISFLNPQNLKISVDEMQYGQADPDISIIVQPISEYIKKCLASDEQRGAKLYEKETYYKEILNELKINGYHSELPNYDSASCGWTAGNINSEYSKIDGINGIIYNKALYQEVGSLSVFYKQVIFVDEYDRVYDIVFNYDFGELGNYLATIREEGGSAYAYNPNDPENWGSVERTWQEVMDYFEKEKPIEDERIKGFEENEKVINEIIKSIKIDVNKVLQTIENSQIQDQTKPVEVDQANPLKSNIKKEDEINIKNNAFISIPDINTLSRTNNNNAYYINGSTSNNCEKVVVSAINNNAGINDVYPLKNYKKGDVTFKYGIREDWNNLFEGENTYVFTAHCDGGQIKEVSTTLVYTITANNKPANNITFPTFWDGYQWAADNSVNNFYQCLIQFEAGFAQNGCNQYLEDNYSEYNISNDYGCTEDCSGHEAGYEWAAENGIYDIYDCEGNSDSFIEGCESYIQENYY